MDLNRGFEPRYLFLKFFFCHFLICVFCIDQLIIALVYRLNLLFLPVTWLKKKKIDNKIAYGFCCNGHGILSSREELPHNKKLI